MKKKLVPKSTEIVVNEIIFVKDLQCLPEITVNRIQKT